MSEETTKANEMSVFDKIIGIFTSPRETFESINQNPSWIVPFFIGLAFFLIFQYTTVDIQMADQIAKFEARDLPAAQLEAARAQTQGFAKYLGFIIGPMAILVIWVIYAALFLLFGNFMIGGETSFKKIFSVVAWSSLIGSISVVLLTFLITSKGTTHGIGMDLSLLLTTPAVGAEPGLLYLILSKFDLFVIWQVILWIIGLSVAYNTTTNKAAAPILTLWGIWIVVSVAFASILGPLF